MTFEIQNGCFGYEAGRQLLKNICVRLEAAQIMTVLGANGVGKTTLMKCMLGLLHWTEGQSRIDGADIRTVPHSQLWQRIGYVPQARQSAFAYTAEEMVLLGRSAHLGLTRQPREEDRRIARESLEVIGVSHLRGRLLSRVSGGELQMVLIARALAAQPRLLILDEPESNLDFRNQLIVLDTIRRLRDERGLSFIVNTHYPEHAISISDQTLLLLGGGESLCGPTREVITEGNLRRAFSVEVCIRDLPVDRRQYTCVLPLKLA